MTFPKVLSSAFFTKLKGGSLKSLPLGETLLFGIQCWDPVTSMISQGSFFFFASNVRCCILIKLLVFKNYHGSYDRMNFILFSWDLELNGWRTNRETSFGIHLLLLIYIFAVDISIGRNHTEYLSSRHFRDFQTFEMWERDGQSYQNFPFPHVDKIK